MPAIEGCKDERGKLIIYAWPGGYPMLYITDEGDVLCPKCAQTLLDSPETRAPEKPSAGDIYWEGPPETCAECNEEIESAYGDPAED